MAHSLLKAGPNMNVRKGQKGYSLVEMLAVVAIIGIMSLIVVPNFVQYYRSIRLKTAMRRMTNDLRAARQRAVARNSMVMISYKTDTNRYQMWESVDQGATWGQLGTTTQLDTPISISDSGSASTSMTDAFKGDGWSDCVFRADGTALLPAGVTTGEVIVKTSDKVAVPSYRVSIASTGKIAAQ